VPWQFRRADGESWGPAGLWNTWADKATGEVVESYTLLTINADVHRSITGEVGHPVAVACVPGQARERIQVGAAADRSLRELPMPGGGSATSTDALL
jgi:hypothetical protein